MAGARGGNLRPPQSINIAGGKINANICGQDAPLLVTLTNPTDITDVIVSAIDAQTTALTASIQAVVDTLDAGITVNAVQSGAWSFTVDGQPVTVALDQATIDSLTTALEGADLSVSISGQDADLNVNITNDPFEVTVDFTALTDFLRTSVRVDYEATKFCILDANGEEVAGTGVFTEIRYDFEGNALSRELVTSIINGSSWDSYTLGAGETIGLCPAEGTIIYAGDVCVGQIVFDGDPVALDQDDFTLPDGTAYTRTGGTNFQRGDIAGDQRWENTSIVTHTFDKPVTFIVSPSNSPNLLNPLTWTHRNGVGPTNPSSTRMVTNGDPITYEEGQDWNLDPFFSNGDMQVNANQPDSADILARDLWGTFTAPNATLVEIRSYNADAMNISVIEGRLDASNPQTLQRFELPDGTTIYKDSSGAIVPFDPALVIPCPVQITNDCIVTVGKNDVTLQRCFEVQNALTNTSTGRFDIGSAATSNNIVFDSQQDGLITRIEIQVDNTTVNEVDLPIVVAGQTLQISDLNGFPFPASGLIPAGRYPVVYDLPTPLQVVDGVPVVISSLNGSVAGVNWTGGSDDADGRLSFSANGSSFPQVAFYTEGATGYTERTFGDGRVEIRDELGTLLDAVPSSASLVPCVEPQDEIVFPEGFNVNNPSDLQDLVVAAIAAQTAALLAVPTPTELAQTITRVEDTAPVQTSITAPYKSYSVTAYSGDVTVDGAAINSGQTVGVTSNVGEVYSVDVVINGSDYVLTEVK